MEHQVGKVLRRLLYERGIDEATLSTVTGVSKSNISRMKNDSQSNPTYASLKPIADYFGISVSQLLGEEHMGESSTLDIRVPLIPLSEINSWLTGCNKDYPSLVTQLALSPKGFACIIEDKTLGPLFPYGATVLCDNQRDFQDGDYVFVRQDKSKSIMLKQLVREGDEYYLKSLRPEIDKLTRLSSDYQLLAVIIEIRYQP